MDKEELFALVKKLFGVDDLLRFGLGQDHLTLRRKLEQAGLGEGGGIETMRQQGYRFSLETLPAGAQEERSELVLQPSGGYP